MKARCYPILLDPASVPRGRVLVFSPHPDDEVIGCGGTLAFHARRGARVVWFYLPVVWGGAVVGGVGEDLVTVRREEARAAGREIGVAEIHFWDYGDGRLSEWVEEGSDRVRVMVDAVRPGVIYYPSPFEIHPDHVAASRIVSRGWRSSSFLGWAMMCEIGNPVPATHLLDVTAEVERKRRAIRRYASQLLYHDIEGKALAHNRARCVNIDLVGVEFAEAFLRASRDRVDAIEKLAEATSALVESLMDKV